MGWAVPLKWTELSSIGCPLGELSSLGNTNTEKRGRETSSVSFLDLSKAIFKADLLRILALVTHFPRVLIVVLTFFYASITDYWLHTPLFTCYSNIFYGASDKIKIYIFGKCFPFQWITDYRSVCLELCAESVYPLTCESVHLCVVRLCCLQAHLEISPDRFIFI